MHAGGHSHPHQCGEAARLHLVHDPRTMDLDSARAHPEIVGDHLVLITGQELFQDFALARSERGYPPIDLGDIDALFARRIDRLQRRQMASIKASPGNGFSMKSLAPALSAWTASGTSP